MLSGTPVTFENIPNEIIAIIMSYLEVKNLYRNRLINRKIKEIIDNLKTAEAKFEIEIFRVDKINYFNALRAFIERIQKEHDNKDITPENYEKLIKTIEPRLSKDIETIQQYEKLNTFFEKFKLPDATQQAARKAALLKINDAILDPNQYRKLIQTIRRDYVNGKLSQATYNDLIIPTNTSVDKLTHNYKNICLSIAHPILHGLMGVFSLCAMFYFLSKANKLEKCPAGIINELDISSCQQSIDQILLNNFLSVVTQCATLGFFAKATERGIVLTTNFFLLNDSRFSLLPKISSQNPSLLPHQFSFYFFSILKYYDLLILAPSFYFTKKLISSNLLNLDIKHCVNKFANYSFFDFICLNHEKNTRIDELYNTGAMQGLFYSYSFLSACIILSMLILKFCRRALNYHQHGLFSIGNNNHKEIALTDVHIDKDHEIALQDSTKSKYTFKQ